MIWDYVTPAAALKVEPLAASLVATDGPVRCAFDCCQAGGDILPRAPRVSGVRYDPASGQTSVRSYHPGCLVAWLQEPPF